MQCPRCQQENPPQAKFCLECGARVALTCPKCRSELPSSAKFFLECGEPVAPQVTAEAGFASPTSYTPKHLAEKIITSKAALEGERKQVTVLFADLKGSMELLADRDPEEARKILDPVLERMMEAVHRYEGTVNQVMGDRIMALFGAPLTLATPCGWRSSAPSIAEKGRARLRGGRYAAGKIHADHQGGLRRPDNPS
jgi:Double zinc ribbon/Adenylate and Guanylate cyclase catalytic domain